MRPHSFEGIEHARPQVLASLIGQNRSEIYDRFGAPILYRNEETRVLWSYQSNACAMLIYFDEMGICRHAETRGICQ